MGTNGQVASEADMLLTRRIIAGVIDGAIVIGLCFFPRVGWLLGLVYLLARDAMPFLDGQSFGKQLQKLVAITIPHGHRLTNYPARSVIRGLVTLVPVLNIIDLIILFRSGYRLADKWANTTVVQVDDDSGSVGKST